MENYHNKAFGNVIRDLRTSKGWSQELLGFESNLTRTYISLLERGLRSPTLDTIISIAEALGVPHIDFFNVLVKEIDVGKS